MGWWGAKNPPNFIGAIMFGFSVGMQRLSVPGSIYPVLYTRFYILGSMHPVLGQASFKEAAMHVHEPLICRPTSPQLGLLSIRLSPCLSGQPIIEPVA